MIRDCEVCEPKYGKHTASCHHEALRELKAARDTISTLGGVVRELTDKAWELEVIVIGLRSFIADKDAELRERS